MGSGDECPSFPQCSLALLGVLFMIGGLVPGRNWQLRSKPNRQMNRIVPLEIPLLPRQLRRYDNGDTTIKTHPLEGSYGR